MIHKAEDLDARTKHVVDCMGTKVPNVLEFNDETFEALIMLVGDSIIKSPDGESRLGIVEPVVADLNGCHATGTFKGIRIQVKIAGAKVIYES